MHRGTQRRWIGGLAAIALLACGVAVPAGAQEDEEEERRPFFAEPALYLMAGANHQWPTRTSDIEDEVERGLMLPPGTLVSSDVDSSWGANGRLGYRLNDHLALETQVEWVTNFEVDVQIAGVEAREEIALFTWTGNARYFFGTGRLQPYLVAGAGWGRSRVKPANGSSTNRENGWVARGGGGLQFFGNRDVALTLEATYVHPASGGIEDLDYVSLTAGFILFFYPGN